jgi:hypothetical protein
VPTIIPKCLITSKYFACKRVVAEQGAGANAGCSLGLIAGIDFIASFAVILSFLPSRHGSANR